MDVEVKMTLSIEVDGMSTNQVRNEIETSLRGVVFMGIIGRHIPGQIFCSPRAELLSIQVIPGICKNGKTET